MLLTRGSRLLGLEKRGSGFLDQNGVDPLEFAWNGDTAIAGVQYSYLPSWISLLADQDVVKETSRVTFDTVHQYWSTLPDASRPKLYLYGLSLGSFGVESILSSINIINEPVDGALMVGPPFVNELHAQLTAAREASSSSTLPVYEQGRTVRFTAERDALEPTSGEWGPTRIVYLQHASDPIVFFNQSLAFTAPEWLEDGQRGPDVSERMGWFPVVTVWQVLLDLPGRAASRWAEATTTRPGPTSSRGPWPDPRTGPTRRRTVSPRCWRPVPTGTPEGHPGRSTGQPPRRTAGR